MLSLIHICLQRRAELVHIRYQGAWFSLWIILPEGNEIIVLTRQETANVFGVTGQGVVACDSQKYGTAVAQMRFGCQGNGGICHAAGKMCIRDRSWSPSDWACRR